jgi:hypothetical protein
MAILKELTAKSGTYTNRDGQEKASYVRCGVMLETRNGPALKLEALPVNFDGWIYLHDPKPKEEKQAPKQQASDDSDPIPF